jgi:3-oxoacyl-[acyl-carrier protein] reductase
MAGCCVHCVDAIGGALFEEDLMAFDWGDEFTQKRVVVTGACGTYGRWYADAFAKAGARLCLLDRDGAALDAMGNDMGLSSRGGMQIACNLLETADTRRAVAQVETAWGAPDIVINNAGIYPRGSLLDCSDDMWAQVMGINLDGVFRLTRDFASLMIGQKVRGSIVNVTSNAARVLRRDLVPYAVSKGAVDRLSKGFALELAPHGIRVNTIEPGFAPNQAMPPEVVQHFVETIPLKRTSGPEDAPAAVMFLCSSRASFITGATMNTDGGYPLQG